MKDRTSGESETRVRRWPPLLRASMVVLFLASNAYADSFSVNVTVDENCNGTFTNTIGFFSTLPCALQNDPGPGGLSNVQTYSLLNPPGLTAGDVLLQDGVGGLVLDVVRFNSSEICTDRRTGCLLFC